MKSYRLLLIHPRQKYSHYGVQEETARILGKKYVYTSLALPLIAALTPDTYDIRIVDEGYQSIPARFRPNIVGITTLTASIGRAYEIADGFRKRGVTVVLGGPYATYVPDECLEHADAVVIGEAEGVWPRLLNDFENRRMQRRYASQETCEFKVSPLPRWDLMETRSLVSLSVQATRGCPYHCEFCVVTQMFGKRVRFREIDNVIAELRALPLKRLLFVDDNLTINKPYARELMTRMIPLGLSWNCQVSIDVADDEELLRLMYEAGCNYMIIGFESLNPASLGETSKHQNLQRDYRTAIDKIHRAGLQTYASFVVGFDHDTAAEFGRIEAFVEQARVPIVMLSILGASPGTELHARLRREGRWYGGRLDVHGGTLPVFHYARIGQVELLDAYYAAMGRLYACDAMARRALPLLEEGHFSRGRDRGDVGLVTKVRASLSLTRRYLFARDRSKRAFFLAVFRLMRRKKVSAEVAVMLLTIAESVNRSHARKVVEAAEIRSYLSTVDRGPWCEGFGAGSRGPAPT